MYDIQRLWSIRVRNIAYLVQVNKSLYKNDSEDEQCSCSKINVKIKLYLINKTITLYLKNITLMKSK